MPNTTTLSDIPSELLTQAVDDLDRLRKLPDYSVDMTVWGGHEYDLGHMSCSFCLAGATLIGTLGVDPHNYGDIANSDEWWMNKNKMWALNKLRSGYIYAALDELGIPYPSRNVTYSWPVTNDDPVTPSEVDVFICEMRGLAAYLKEHNL